MNPPTQTVTLRLRNDGEENPGTLRPDLDPASVDALLRQAKQIGLDGYLDKGTAAVLATARVQPDIPPGLYAALSAVLSRIDAAARQSEDGGTD